MSGGRRQSITKSKSVALRPGKSPFRECCNDRLNRHEKPDIFLTNTQLLRLRGLSPNFRADYQPT